MSTERNLSIGTKLVIVSILCVVPIIIFIGFILHNKVQDTLLSQINASQASNLDIAAEQIDREVYHLQNTATVIATDSVIRKALDTYSSIGINSHLNRIAAVYPQLNYITLIDDLGTIFAVNTINGDKFKVASEDALGRDIRQHPFYNPLANTEPSISPPGLDPYFELFELQATHSQWFTAPIIIRGQPKGWVILSYQFEPVISALLSNLITRLQEQDYPAIASRITDAKGHKVAGLPHDGLDSLDKSIALPIGGAELSLQISYERHRVLSPLIELEDSMLWIAVCLILILTLALYWSIGKLMIAPIKRLEAGARRFSDGDFSQTLSEAGSAELTQLARTFNSMGASIAAARDTLEEQVKYRTAQAEQATEEVQAIVDSAADAIVTTHPNGIVISFNKAAELLFQHDAQDLIGHNIDAILTEDITTPAWLASSRDALGHESVAQKKSGFQFPVFISTAVSSAIITATIRDITLTKQTESTLIAAKDAAEMSARYKSEFLASMSHEIRTPMNGVIGMLTLLLQDSLSPQQQHKAEVALSSARSLLTIINDILDFSKVEAGKLELEVIDFHLRSLLDDFTESMAHRAQEKGLELILDASQVQQSVVGGDPGRIRQILSNLVGNAIKFTERGEVIIRAELKPSANNALTLSCVVEDTGIGISTAKLATVFESFTQVDASTTRHYGGTGLGLAIAKQLCELMGGSISVSSEELSGSQFAFHIELATSNESQKVLPSADINNIEVLIVDDNATNREVLQKQLALWGAKVTVAEGAETALQLMHARQESKADKHFDIAILDMLMPKMDGAELARSIRRIPAFEQTKLIMMTSMSSRGDANYFRDLGFAAYFPKPITTNDLFTALNVVMDDGAALEGAQPLLTRHYMNSLKTVADGNQDTDKATRSLIPSTSRLLLVEDNPINQLVATGLLEDMGLSCDIAENGQEALNLLQAVSPDTPYPLILMDCQMPEMDGYETTRQIRASNAGARHKNIVIIAMTANAMAGDREKCLASGMDDYISKPIEPDELEAKLRHHLTGTASPAHKDSLEATDDFLGTPLWSEPALLKRVGNKHARLVKIIATCLAEMPAYSQQLQALLEAQCWGEITEQAHMLKGISANLSALRLERICAAIELAARDQDLNRTQTLVQAYHATHQQLRDKLEHYSLAS